MVRMNRHLPFLAVLVFLAGAVLALGNRGSSSDGTSPIPSASQAASLAKQILYNRTAGTLMVRLPPDAAGEEYTDFPYGQVELIAQDCESSGDVLFFGSELEQTIHSIVHYRANASLHLRVWNPAGDETVDPLLLHRTTLLGHVERLAGHGEPDYDRYGKNCFFKKHPDAVSFGLMKSHAFRFYRLKVTKVHYVGGFGNSHYIGWIPMDLWTGAPSTSLCSDWKGCAGLMPQKGWGPDERCCPYDSDNAMRECCFWDEGDETSAKSGPLGAGEQVFV